MKCIYEHEVENEIKDIKLKLAPYQNINKRAKKILEDSGYEYHELGAIEEPIWSRRIFVAEFYNRKKYPNGKFIIVGLCTSMYDHHRKRGYLKQIIKDVN